MTKIEEFLTKFDDQHLANLQCAAEDGRLVFQDACNCLLHHFRGEYSVTKWEGEIAVLARAAEAEFLELGGLEPTTMKRYPDGSFSIVLGSTKIGDPQRRTAILSLIHAEWHRRLREELAKQINEEGGICTSFALCSLGLVRYWRHEIPDDIAGSCLDV